MSRHALAILAIVTVTACAQQEEVPLERYVFPGSMLEKMIGSEDWLFRETIVAVERSFIWESNLDSSGVEGMRSRVVTKRTPFCEPVETRIAFLSLDTEVDTFFAMRESSSSYRSDDMIRITAFCCLDFLDGHQAHWYEGEQGIYLEHVSGSSTYRSLLLPRDVRIGDRFSHFLVTDIHSQRISGMGDTILTLQERTGISFDILPNVWIWSVNRGLICFETYMRDTENTFSTSKRRVFNRLL